ncbi:MAG: ribonuclease HII [Flavobacteriales bacterium]|nr:ribonuclease HII [Flavobacteriales bacterium]
MLKLAVQIGICEAGCDEAGRGCLAGPVVAGAVILPPDYRNPLLNDSKKLTEKQRLALRTCIEKDAVEWAVADATEAEIDSINILKASFLAMHRALDQLRTPFEHIAVDGNRFTPYKDILHSTIVGGDAKYMHIAAASVLAKTHRDERMQQLHSLHPEYGWDRNKGYPTAAHRLAIRQFGSTPYHRMSFQLLPAQLTLL